MATVAANSTTPASAPSRTPPPASARAATIQVPGFIGEPLSNSPSPLPSTVGRMPSATTSNSSSVKDHASFVGERAGHELRVICLKDPRALFAYAVAIISMRNFFDRIAPRPRSGARHRHSRCGRHGGQHYLVQWHLCAGLQAPVVERPNALLLEGPRVDKWGVHFNDVTDLRGLTPAALHIVGAPRPHDRHGWSLLSALLENCWFANPPKVELSSRLVMNP